MNTKMPKIGELMDTAKRWGVRGLGRLRRSELGKMLARLLPERPVRELIQLGRRLGLEGLSGLRKNELVKRLTAYLKGEKLPLAAPAEKSSPQLRKDEHSPGTKATGAKPVARPMTGRLELVARDPNWLYAWWDFNAELRRRLSRAGTVPVLRVVAVEADGSERQVARIDLPLHARSWHLRVERAAACYRAYLELRHSRGATEVVLVSQSVRTPGAAPASEAAVVVADAAGRERLQPPPPDRVQRRLHRLSTAPRAARQRHVPSSAGQEVAEIPSSGSQVPSSR
jgi:hypothetical protein